MATSPKASGESRTIVYAYVAGVITGAALFGAISYYIGVIGRAFG